MPLLKKSLHKCILLCGCVFVAIKPEKLQLASKMDIQKAASLCSRDAPCTVFLVGYVWGFYFAPPLSIDLLVLFCWVCLICFQFPSVSLGFSQSPLKLSLEKRLQDPVFSPKGFESRDFYKLSLSLSPYLTLSGKW